MTTNRLHKKDLGMIAKSYGYVYVAQVAMGASQAQYFSRRPRTPLKSKSNEVSNHGIKIGMGRTQSRRPRTQLNKLNAVSNEEKLAVECGYSLFTANAIEEPMALLLIWHYNPDEDGQVLKAANTDGKEEMKVSNGFHLDSKEPDWSKLLTALIME